MTSAIDPVPVPVPVPLPVGETAWLELHAEEIAITKRRTAETVRVTARTRTRDVVVDEPLLRETVTVERVPVGRYVETMPAVRQEGDVTIMPVVEEEVVVTRRLFLREEVRVQRVTIPGRHTETVSLREQVATVSRSPAELTSSTGLASSNGHQGPEQRARTSTMDSETIVAVYDTPAAANAAVADLRSANVPESAISRHSDTVATTGTGSMTGSMGATGTGAWPSEGGGFWSSLFGGDVDHHQDATVYDRSVQGGSSVVVVKATPEHDIAAVVAILERHAPIDLDERASSYGLSSGMTGTTGMAATTNVQAPAATAGMAAGMTGAAMESPGVMTPPAAPMTMAAGSTGVARETKDGMMQLSEEQIAIGKRVINRGGTRIRRYVVETPVQENVSLRDETVTLERHPVADGRPATDGSFSEKTIEMTATAEEAVVSKTARVVEEVGLRKEATDRTETIRDTVRKEEVEVEQLPAGTASQTTVVDTTKPRV